MERAKKRPNVVFVFADQLRRQATGFGGETNIETPHMDKLASESVDFVNAVSGTPVCCPARATLQTGQYPHRHGVIINDVNLDEDSETMGKLFSRAGYDTGYIGKWHIDGNGRSNHIPRNRQQGFDYWKVLECTHDYNESFYYEGASCEKKMWNGYDAIAQTRDATEYIKSRKSEEDPFLLVLSWGPPHDPYETAPMRYLDQVEESEIVVRANVPEGEWAKARSMLKGYYAHVLALDDCLGELLETLEGEGLAEDTVFIFWSDHGDQLLSHGELNKQRPWEESIRVPLLLRYPREFGRTRIQVNSFIDAPDILPTLLEICSIKIPECVDGKSHTEHVEDSVAFSRTTLEKSGGKEVGEGLAPLVPSVLLACHSPFGQYTRDIGGREFRGVRTLRYTYVRDLKGPWLLFDNFEDPYQLNNLCGKTEMADLQAELESELNRLLVVREDAFVPGGELLEKFGYAARVDETGTMPYSL